MIVANDTEPAGRYQVASDSISSTNRMDAPPRSPIPSERSAKSATVVPSVVVATITSQ